MSIVISIIKDIRRYLKLKIFQKKWRKRNKNNYTIAGNIFCEENVEVGNFTYGILNINYYHAKNEFLKIGNFCSIARDVQFITGGNHEYRNVMTYPFKNKLSNNKIKEAISKGPIIIQDDVWIGYGSIILSGVTIGQGAIIAAGSIITKDIPPYAIFAGNRIIKYRFDSEIIEKLKTINFSDLDNETLKKNIDYLYKKCNRDNIDEIILKINGEKNEQ